MNVDPPRRYSTVADLQEQLTKNTSKKMLAQAAKAVERNAGEINRRCSDGREIPDALDDNWSRYLRGLGRSAATKRTGKVIQCTVGALKDFTNMEYEYIAEQLDMRWDYVQSVSYTHLRAHET